MGKLDINKKKKHDALLDSAYNLFTTKGFSKTSISEIVNNAHVAKGTFYLYFDDKFDLKDKLTSFKSKQIFRKAFEDLESNMHLSFNDRVIFVVDNIINQLSTDKRLLAFVAKNLSWGVFKSAIDFEDKSDQINVRKILVNAPDTLREPEILLFMIVEIISSVIYSSVLYNEPKKFEEIRPFLYQSIRNMVDNHVNEFEAVS